MTNRRSHLTRTVVAIVIAFFLAPGVIPSAGAARFQEVDDEPGDDECSVDLTNAGSMKDIISNALMLGLGRPESKIAAFLEGAEDDYDSGNDLLEAAAAHFALEVSVLSAEVLKFEHCNCAHGPLDGSRVDDDPNPTEVSRFAKDVMFHVVLHEMGHALVREFDLPVLGNEETLADAFATHYLTTHLPEHAASVLQARVASLMVEAEEIPRNEWTVRGEHNSDARRAFQIAALAVAADATRYRPVAETAGMTEEDIRRARDYGSEIHRSWRRILRPLWMPHGLASTEARLSFDEDSTLLRNLCEDGLAEELETALKRFDWHSQVKIAFEEGEGGASWSRSKRTITVRGAYARRFIAQGKR